MQRFTARQYLAIDIANNFGLDKLTWDERLDWFQRHEAALESYVSTAETPALYHAGVQAYRAVQRGEPIGYPVSFDATSSGLQILACLTGDRRAAEICNVVNRKVDGKTQRADAYTIIYQMMMRVLGEDGQLKREDTKQAIMTAFYGSKAVPKEVFGEGPLLNLFYATMGEAAPAAWELNEAFLAMWDNTKLCNSWVLPDNFHVHVKVMGQVQQTVHFLGNNYDTFRKVNMTQEEGRSLGANTTHSIDGMIVRELTRRCSYDPKVIQRVLAALNDGGEEQGSDDDAYLVRRLWEHYLASGYLSARILDHLFYDNAHLVDAEVIKELIRSLPRVPFQLMTVHDCFRCLPHYVNDLREQYNRQLYLIAKSNLLQFIVSQILGRQVQVDKLDPTLADDILEADYALS